MAQSNIQSEEVNLGSTTSFVHSSDTSTLSRHGDKFLSAPLEFTVPSTATPVENADFSDSETLSSSPQSGTFTCNSTSTNSFTSMLQKVTEKLNSEEERSNESSVSTLGDNSDSGFFLGHSSLLASKLRSASASASTLSLSSLTIPSHKQFGKLIHKHEVPRKVFHTSIGFLTLWLYTQGIVLTQVTPILFALFIIVTGSDFLRFRNADLNAIYCKVLGPLMREKEVNTYNGVIWYLLGLVIVFTLFPKDVSLLSVLLLSWADTAASTFGRAYGHLTPKYGNKSLAGSLASFATGIISSILLYKYFIPKYDYLNKPGDVMWTPETSSIPFPLLVFLVGLVGAISEGIDVFSIDDNFTIPVLTAFFVWPVLKLGMKEVLA